MSNPAVIASGLASNRRRAAAAGRRQAGLAQHALVVVCACGDSRRMRWIAVLHHRIDNPAASLRELAETMTPPMSKDAYAAALRRALRAAESGGQV